MLRYTTLLLLLFVSVGFTFAQELETDEKALSIIEIPMSMYLLVNDIDDPNVELSTVRTEDGLRIIHDNMNEIWSQANIQLDLQHVGYLAVPEPILEDIIRGNFAPFFEAVGDGSIPITNVSQINGFYAKDIGGPNGIMLNSQVYFVNDEPTVNDERVSSHEVGHMFGLHHELSDSNRLMYSGTNGIGLSEIEIIVARYYATGFLQGVRR